MYTITKIAKQFGLSRSTLLYYDKIGLLSPSSRSDSGYRLYSEKDRERLQIITQFREAGVPLEKIKEGLTGNKSETSKILRERLDALNCEIGCLRRQQQIIVKLLQDRALRRSTRVLNKKIWVAMLRAAGLDDEGMRVWHAEFENAAPEAHQDFLESLGLPASEIQEIRISSKKSKNII